MWWIYAVCIAIGLSSIAGAQYLIHREKRRINRVKEGIEWQFTKAQKVADGWRPSLYDDGATEDERYEAIIAYAEGEGHSRSKSARSFHLAKRNADAANETCCSSAHVVQQFEHRKARSLPLSLENFSRKARHLPQRSACIPS